MATSEARSRCGKSCARTGHVYVAATDTYEPCPCMLVEKNQRRLGKLFEPELYLGSPLRKDVGRNLFLEGPLREVRRHAAGAVLHLERLGRTWSVLDSQRAADIWLGKDEEFTTSARPASGDLLVFFLGFGELPNRRLPEVILEVLDRRMLEQRPTWIISSYDRAELGARYGAEVERRILDDFERVRVGQ